MAHRSPELHDALRLYCLAGFALLQDEVDRGADVPFAFEEHEASGRTTFYEFRPLILSFVEARADRLPQLPPARPALAGVPPPARRAPRPRGSPGGAPRAAPPLRSSPARSPAGGAGRRRSPRRSC